MSEATRLLIIEDEKVVQDIFRRLFRNTGYRLTFFDRGDEGVEEFERNATYDCVITDLMLPGVDGLEVLKRVVAASPDTPVIMVTAYASVDSAVDAMRHGAFDYLAKPFNNDEVLMVVKKALDRVQLMEENRSLKQALNQKYGIKNIVGNSPTMQEVFDLIYQAAPSMATILIRGESGTGKELVARAVHHNSSRKNKAFVTINAGAIPENLLESHLFGHLKGSFTGALSDKKGMFETADGGTLFLDEIGNISMELQAKLLRVIQEKEVMPVGSTEYSKIDVRLICATNADLERMVQENQFREDLYYRLNVIEIRLPPLRERMEDLPLLVDHFISQFEASNQKKIHEVRQDFMDLLESYPWPGNIRELENLLERVVVLSRDGNVDASLLPPNFKEKARGDDVFVPNLNFSNPLSAQVQALEKALITKALKASEGVQKNAAALLGLKTTTLNEMMKRHKMR